MVWREYQKSIKLTANASKPLRDTNKLEKFKKKSFKKAKHIALIFITFGGPIIYNHYIHFK